MNKQTFLSERKPVWDRFESLLDRASPAQTKLSSAEVSELSELFRALCYDLAQVRSRDWGSSIERYLNDLVVRGHSAFYGAKPLKRGGVLGFFARGFPQLLRRNHRFFWAACVLFAIPMAISWTVVVSDPSLARRVLPGSVLYTMERMYSQELDDVKDVGDVGEEGLGQDHQDAAMAGFYVRHNTSIAFQCFALGFFLGLGTIYVLLSNGIQLGTVAGYLIAQGHGERFLGFVASHSSFELTAIVVSGAAGLVLGHAIVAPGNRSRGEALQARGLVAVKLALGAAAMLVVAAMVEGFWSAQPLPRMAKYSAAAVLWIAVIAYLGFAGRERRS
ncbi:MAG: stage II sporulation protein M [Acidobacteriota bacterium]|nr:MAG: stage II sporulation protein M [Acidobacteriota bacterium]